MCRDGHRVRVKEEMVHRIVMDKYPWELEQEEKEHRMEEDCPACEYQLRRLATPEAKMRRASNRLKEKMYQSLGPRVWQCGTVADIDVLAAMKNQVYMGGKVGDVSLG